MAEQLRSVRTNITYVKTKDGQYEPVFEMIWLVDKPLYHVSNEGDTVRERGLEQLRWTCGKETLLDIAKLLTGLAEKETDALED